jgi:hypothetical protein
MSILKLQSVCCQVVTKIMKNSSRQVCHCIFLINNRRLEKQSEFQIYFGALTATHHQRQFACKIQAMAYGMACAKILSIWRM